MADPTNKPPGIPPIHALEGNVFGALFDFHEKVMALLRAANLPDDKLGVASARIGHLLRATTKEIKLTHDLNVQPRLDAVYEELQRFVAELVTLGSIRDQMEQIYRQMQPADIPWNNETPPKVLVELIEAGQVQPCKAIDLGCGTGHCAIYLAGLGFDVTGVDISPTAIALAEALPRETADRVVGIANRTNLLRKANRSVNSQADGAVDQTVSFWRVSNLWLGS